MGLLTRHRGLKSSPEFALVWQGMETAAARQARPVRQDCGGTGRSNAGERILLEVSAHKRTSFIVVLSCLGALALAAVLLGRNSGAERLAYSPAGSDADAQALVARLLDTNLPWLDPKLVRAAYSVRQTSLEWQLGDALRQRSWRRLYRQGSSTNAVTVKWRSEPGRRVGTRLQTPLTAMLESRSNYAVRMVGKGRWRGKTVVAVDATFHPPAAVRADYLDHAGVARILIEPGQALPLFIGTSQAGSFGAKPRFESTFEFGPDFFGLDGGRAPRSLSGAAEAE